MKFSEHENLVGKHSFLSPSQTSRFKYDEERLIKTYGNIRNTERGTKLHEIAAQIIDFNLKNPEQKILLAKNGSSYNMYVNDATRFKLNPEVPLYYSEYCFGTADAIDFRNNFLRIHDLKTGTIPAHMEQLENYAALFFLEYGKILNVKPIDISIELRIYQNGEILIHKPEPESIEKSMEYIIWADSVLREHFSNRGKEPVPWN